MKIISYIKNNGIKRPFEVLWIYKIELLLEKMMLPFFRNKPLKNIIVIESHNDFDCNGGAFYNYLVDNHYNNNYRIIWLVRKKYNTKLPYNVSTVPLYGPNLRKAYYMCNYKYMTFDCEGGRKTRTEQKLVFCSHGAGGLKASQGLVKISADVDYVLLQSKEYTKIQAKQWSISPNDPRNTYIGYPAHDILLQNDKSEVKRITTQQFNKTILWMPTFRKGIVHNRNDSNKEQKLGIPLFQTVEEIYNLNKLLEQYNILLVIKIHPKQDLSSLKIHDMSNIKVITGNRAKELGIDNYRLMRSVDALISDYSGAAYEFLQLNRPIAYVLDDVNEYKLGFVVQDIHKLIAGHEIYNKSDLENFIMDVVHNRDKYKKKRQNIRNYIYDFHDMESCKRLVKLLNM